MTGNGPSPLLLTPDEEKLAARVAAAATDLEGPEPAPGDVRAEDDQALRVLSSLAREGLIAEVVPPRYRRDGAGGDVSARRICVVRDGLAYASGLADVMFVMQGLGSFAVTLAGSEETKRDVLPGVGSGEVVAAFALTEPGAGSDISAVATRAVRDGNDYVLDGVKTFISNAGLAGVYTVLARTGGASSGRDGLTAFAVDGGAPGLRLRERLAVSAPHPIGTIELSGCRVPASRRLGEEGTGHDLALQVLDRFRPTVGAAAAGLARRAVDASVARCRQRIQFGRRIADFQAIRFKLADMALQLDAARLLVLRAASLVDAPGAATPAASRRASSMAKLYATEAAQRIVDDAVQIHGGLGVTRGQVVERLYREVRALRIYEGTSEIQRLIIARTLLAEAP